MISSKIRRLFRPVTRNTDGAFGAELNTNIHAFSEQTDLETAPLDQLSFGPNHEVRAPPEKLHSGQECLLHEGHPSFSIPAYLKVVEPTKIVTKCTMMS